MMHLCFILFLKAPVHLAESWHPCADLLPSDTISAGLSEDYSHPHPELHPQMFQITPPFCCTQAQHPPWDRWKLPVWQTGRALCLQRKVRERKWEDVSVCTRMSDRSNASTYSELTALWLRKFVWCLQANSGDFWTTLLKWFLYTGFRSFHFLTRL